MAASPTQSSCCPSAVSLYVALVTQDIHLLNAGFFLEIKYRLITLPGSANASLDM